MLICSAPCAAHCSSKLKLYRPQSRKARAKKPAQGRLWWWMVQTGGVLAAVSLPDYNLASWRQDYAALTAAETSPLVNRVLNGQYAPGSAFKPAVAASALAAGIITPQSTVNCGRTVHLLCGLPAALFAAGAPRGRQHGYGARHNCNHYFYDVGRLPWGGYVFRLPRSSWALEHPAVLSCRKLQVA